MIRNSALLKHEIKLDLWKIMRWGDFRYQEANKDCAASGGPLIVIPVRIAPHIPVPHMHLVLG